MIGLLGSNLRRLSGISEEEEEEEEFPEYYFDVYNGAWDGKSLHKGRIQATAQALIGASPALEEVSEQLRGKFIENIYQFSSAKNYRELKELNELVYVSETGRKRSFSEFKRAALQVNQSYNSNYLYTEQNFAYGATLMARNWEGFSAEGMLEYRTQSDAAVRDSHRSLHGIRRPKSDLFWNTHYPPNGWGCRCLVVEVNADSPSGRLPS